MAAKRPYGPTIADILHAQERQDNASSLPVSIDTGSPDLFEMKLRRKRQSALLKDMLKEGGYGDLARMVSLKRESNM